MSEVHYRDLKLAGFNHWDVYLSRHQNPYIGACYAWRKDTEENQFPRNIPTEILLEFFRSVEPVCFGAMYDLWKHEYTQIAFPQEPRYNGHSYVMMLPHYKKPITFAGFTFNEPQFRVGKSSAYVPKGEWIETEKLFAIRDALKRSIATWRAVINES